MVLTVRLTIAWGTVLVPCLKGADGSFLLFLESRVTSGRSDSRGELNEAEGAMWLVPGFQGVAQHPIFCNKACQLIWGVFSLSLLSLFPISLPIFVCECGTYVP